jgi:hypothetical protein
MKPSLLMMKPVPEARATGGRRRLGVAPESGSSSGPAGPFGPFGPPKKRRNRSSFPPPPKKSPTSCRPFISVLMKTTVGLIALAMLRKVCASIGPVIGALFIGGAATICAEELCARSSRDESTIPTATEATAIGNE